MPVDEATVLAILEQAQAEAQAAREDTEKAAVAQQQYDVVASGANVQGESNAQSVTNRTLVALNKQNQDGQLTRGLERLDAVTERAEGQLDILQGTQQALQGAYQTRLDLAQRTAALSTANLENNLQRSKIDLEQKTQVALDAERLSATAERELAHWQKYTTEAYANQVRVAYLGSRGMNADGTPMSKSYYKENRHRLNVDYQAKYDNYTRGHDMLPKLVALKNANTVQEANQQVRVSSAALQYEQTQVDMRRATMQLATDTTLNTEVIATYAAKFGVEEKHLEQIVKTTGTIQASVQTRADMIKYQVEQQKIDLMAKQYKSSEAFADAYYNAAMQVNATQGSEVVNADNVRLLALAGPQAFHAAMADQGYQYSLLNSAVITPNNQTGQVLQGKLSTSQFYKSFVKNDFTTADPKDQTFGNFVREQANSAQAIAAGHEQMKASGVVQVDKNKQPIIPNQADWTEQQKSAYETGIAKYLDDPRNLNSTVSQATFNPPFGGEIVQLSQAQLEDMGVPLEWQSKVMALASGTKYATGTATSAQDINASALEIMERMIRDPDMKDFEAEQILTKVLPQVISTNYRNASRINSPAVSFGIVAEASSFGPTKLPVASTRRVGTKALEVQLDATDPLSMLSAFRALRARLTWQSAQDNGPRPASRLFE